MSKTSDECLRLIGSLEPFAKFTGAGSLVEQPIALEPTTDAAPFSATCLSHTYFKQIQIKSINFQIAQMGEMMYIYVPVARSLHECYLLCHAHHLDPKYLRPAQRLLMDCRFRLGHLVTSAKQ